MSSHSLYILWDESHIWGLLAWRAALGLALPFKMVRAAQIAGGLLQTEPPDLLLVPGGSARNKAKALGREGLEAVRNFVARGGHYLGFCGGAGLGLSLQAENQKAAGDPAGKIAPAGSLSLCPWTRASFEERMQHFMSGHLQAALPTAENLPEFARHLLPPCRPGTPPAAPDSPCPFGERANSGPSPDPGSLGQPGAGEIAVPDRPQGLAGQAPALQALSPALISALIPVWWPGRFLPGSGEVAVLARYGAPGPDFWLADLPIAELPENAFSAWQELYGINFSPAFLSGQPCIVHGRFGRGSYTLSYSHLETPDSPFANAWFVHILRSLGQLESASGTVPGWNPELEAKERPRWEDPVLAECLALLASIMQTGVRHGLLFKRNDWLYGWRTGVPGGPLNNLHAVFSSLAALPPSPGSLKLWKTGQKQILDLLRRFQADVTGYLLAERLAMTLSKTMPEAVSAGHLKARRQELFGPPMRAGGLYEKLMTFSEELIFRQF